MDESGRALVRRADRQMASRGTRSSTKELETSINYWIETWNDEPEPFVWHKRADEILDTLATYCARISDSRL
jgi:hypothetical protein